MLIKKYSYLLFFIFSIFLFSSCELFIPITAETTVRNRPVRTERASARVPSRTTTTTTKPDTSSPPKEVAPPSRTTIERPSKSYTREELLRKDIISYAKQYVGIDYKYAGRDPRGFDCSGFTSYVMKNFDVSLSPSSRAQENQGKPISISQAKPGDLIFFRRDKKGSVFHVALVVANDRDGLRVIHSTNRGVVVDNISNNSYWRPKISTARDVL